MTENNIQKQNDEKRKKIIDILSELSEKKTMNTTYLEEVLRKFDEVYTSKFRHFYSDITTLLLSINNNKNPNLSIDLLSENLNQLVEYAIMSNFEHLKELTKLLDHVQMDVARISEWDGLVEQYRDAYTKIEDTTEKLEKADEEIQKAVEESINVKKDLVSIMGIFMGVFSFIQWNFSQYKDLLEYDPFNRVIYIMTVGSLLIISLYFIFAMLDFIIHKNPRMIKPFIDVNTKKVTNFAFFSVILYVMFLAITTRFLYSDSGRATISKLENKINNIQIEHNNRINSIIIDLQNEMKEKELNYKKQIQILNDKIEKLENKK